MRRQVLTFAYLQLQKLKKYKYSLELVGYNFSLKKSLKCFFDDFNLGLKGLLFLIIFLSSFSISKAKDNDSFDADNPSMFAGGNGTSSNPYVIINWAQLHEIRNHLNAHFILGADLNSQTSDYNTFASSTANGGSGWSSPNATNFGILIPFTGTFNGKGYSISDLFINRPNRSSTGIFSILDNGARVENLTIANINITAGDIVGVIAGQTNAGSTIKNVSLFNVEISAAFTAGGIIGLHRGTISESIISQVKIISRDSDARQVGGLVGTLSAGNIEKSGAQEVDLGASNHRRVGGLVGRINDNGGTISNSYATGIVRGAEEIGGAVGSVANSDGILQYVYASVVVPGGALFSGGVYGGIVTPSLNVIYHNRDVSGIGTAQSGITEQQMRDIATFISSGWDLSQVWQIQEGAGFLSFPYLRAITYDKPLTEPSINPIPGLMINEAAAMVLKYDTRKSAGTTIALSFRGAVNLIVNWGDGVTQVVQEQGIFSHTYTEEGEYEVRIVGSLDHFGQNVVGSNNALAGADKLVQVVSFGNLGIKSLQSAFLGAINLTQVASDLPESATNLRSVFEGATQFNQDIASWDVSKVTDMSRMFFRASDFNQPIGSWDVSEVTNFASMFYNASAFNANLSQWDVRKATSFFNMFAEASAFKGDGLSEWQTSSVINMGGMFAGASSFDSDLSKWDVSKVTSMEIMFLNAIAFGGKGLSGWDVSKVINMRGMFQEASNFNSDLSKWDVSFVTDMGSMFAVAEKFSSDLSKWDVSKVTNMRGMFQEASNFNSDLSKWDVSFVTDMGSMFAVAEKFSSDLSKWDVSNVTNMRMMFLWAKNFDSDLSKWDVSKVTNMHRMFLDAVAFTGTGLSEWDISAIIGSELGEMLTNSGLTRENYDALLIAWSRLSEVPSNLHFNASPTQYTIGPASLARQSLIEDFGWTIIDGGEFNPFADGDGSVQAPFQIETAEQLIALSNNPIFWDRYFVQIDDIAFNSDPSQVDWNGDSFLDFDADGEDANGFLPIGEIPSYPFTGSYDGGGFKIENLYISRASSFGVGLFGLASSADIRNLTIANATIVGGTAAAGILAGAVIDNTEIDRVHVSGTISSETIEGTGGLIGQVQGESLISNSSAAVEIEAPGRTGGLVGFLTQSTISKSHISGRITGLTSGSNQPRLGGLVGLGTRSTITKTKSTAAVTSNGSGEDIVGGLIGDSEASEVSQSFSTGSVSANHTGGGLIGRLLSLSSTQALVADSYSTSAVTVKTESGAIGGLIGLVSGAHTAPEIRNSYSAGLISGGNTNRRGGFIGQMGTGGLDATGSFWDIETSEIGASNDTNFGATGKTTAQMKNIDTFTSAGWDFEGESANWTDNIWQIKEGSGFVSYPYLSAFTYDEPLTEPAINPIPGLMINEAAAMVLKFDTQKSAGTTIALSFRGNVNLIVNWGDGFTQVMQEQGIFSHTYTEEGEYEVRIVGSLDHFGQTVVGSNNALAGADKLVKVVSFGDLGIKSLQAAFLGAENLTQVASDLPSTVTNLRSVFEGAYRFNGDISDWQLGNVTDLSRAFWSATAFNQPIGSWDVSNVTTFSSTFRGASQFNANLAGWNVSNVTTFTGMFLGALKFDSDLSQWNVSSVTNMGSMFLGAREFTSDLSAWDVSKVTNMRGMFQEASNFNSDLSQWNVSSVTDMGSMFLHASEFTSDLSAWDVSKVTNMWAMFQEASNFNSDLSQWDISAVVRPEARTGLDGMLTNSGLTRENYDALLISWSRLSGLPSNLHFNASPTQYTIGPASLARQRLVNDFGWTITDGGEFNPFAGGDGSDSSPYLISNWHHLNEIRNFPASNFKLIQDLTQATDGYDQHVALPNGDLVNNGKGWMPIGAVITENGRIVTPFTGTFDGNEKTIEMLRLNVVGTAYQRVGLFAEMLDATVFDLSINNARIDTDGFEQGILAGRCGGCVVSNVAISGSIHATRSRTGGIIGQLEDDSASRGSRIENSSVDIKIMGGEDHSAIYVGGMLGYAKFKDEHSGIFNSTAEVEIIIYRSNRLGGLIGDASDSHEKPMIKNSSATGSITSLAGSQVTYIGGLVGISRGEIINSWANVKIDVGNSGSGDGIGGLVGEHVGIIRSSYALGDIISNATRVGGLAGYLPNNCIVEKTWAKGSIIGQNQVGGLIGRCSGTGTITKSYAMGNVYGSQFDAGGFIGSVEGDVQLSENFAAGHVTGNIGGIGGFIGFLGVFNSSVAVENNYALGAVQRAAGSTNSRVGGFAGYISTFPNGNLILQNNYTIVHVAFAGGDDPIDRGFLGATPLVSGTITASGNFFDTEVSNQLTDIAGLATGKTTAEMKTLSTFTSAGWDFEGESANGTDNIWQIKQLSTDGSISYPYLRAFTYDEPGTDHPVNPIPGLSMPTQLVFVSSEENLLSGDTRKLRVEVRDANNTLVPLDNGRQISFQRVSGTGTVSGLGTASTSGGVAELITTGIAPGEIQIGATSGSLTAALTVFEVQPGVVDRFEITDGNGAPLSIVPTGVSQIEIRALNAAGNLVPRFNETSLTYTTSARGPAGPADLGSWDWNDSGVFTAVLASIQVVGEHTLTLTGTPLAGSSTVSVTTDPFQVVAVTPEFMDLHAGDNQIAIAGMPVDIPPSVLVTDQFGNPVSGVGVTFAVASGGGSVTEANATTNASGIATVGSWTLGTVTGTNTLSATSPGLEGSPTIFTATGTAGLVTKLNFIQQPQHARIGESIGDITVEILDRNNNRVMNNTAAVTLSIADNVGNGALSGEVTVDAVDGLATFSGLSINKIGTGYTLFAESGGNIISTSSTFDITSKELTLYGSFSAENKVYDGNTFATINGSGLSLVGLVAGSDAVSLNLTAVFSQATVGDGLTVSLTEITLTGADSDNYTLSLTDFPTATANITKKELTITGLTGNNKVYDGITTASVTGTAILEGIVGSDDVALSLNPVFTFADANVGEGIAISTNYELTGDDAGNYTLTPPTLSADITPKELTITADDKTKVYGSENPALTLTYSGLVNGDTKVATEPSISTTATANSGVGSYPISLTGGSDANYDITLVSGIMTVQRRVLVIQVDNLEKYVGEEDPPLTFAIISGSLLEGDVITGSLARELGEEVGVYPINIGSLSAGDNYELRIEGQPFFRIKEREESQTIDTIPPTLAINSKVTIHLDADGNAILNVEDVDLGTFDNDVLEELTISKSTFSCNDIGENTIIFTARDTSGNESSAEVTVIVVDDLKPSIQAKSAITLQLDVEGNARLSWEEVDEGSLDNCDIVERILSKTEFIRDDSGEQTITYTVKDASGNAATAEIKVRVDVILSTPTINSEIRADIKLYPNPAKNLLYLELARTMNLDQYVIEIVDASGRSLRVLDTFDYSGKHLRIDTSGLGNGIYFIRISSERSLNVLKFIIER